MSNCQCGFCVECVTVIYSRSIKFLQKGSLPGHHNTHTHTHTLGPVSPAGDLSSISMLWRPIAHLHDITAELLENCFLNSKSTKAFCISVFVSVVSHLYHPFVRNTILPMACKMENPMENEKIPYIYTHIWTLFCDLGSFFNCMMSAPIVSVSLEPDKS